jgi:peptide deformylase
MKEALNAEEDGVAIAAPQINHSLRIFVVAKRASKLLTEDTAFINPVIIRIGKKKEELSEGCLSVRWKYGLVKRATSATVRAYNIDGNEFVMSGRGLLAQIFQHEIDHLNGILFIDKAKKVEDIPPTPRQ